MIPFPHAGEVCALLAPLCWASAVIGFRHSDLPASSMNLFKNVVAWGLLTATLWILQIEIPDDRSARDWGILAASGVLGLAVADTLLFAGLNRIGAARIALVDTVYAPVVVLLAWGVLGEQLSASFAAGAAVVIAGVAIATIERQGTSFQRDRRFVIGLAMGFGAICGTATSVVLVKPLLGQADLIEVTWTRMGSGMVAQCLWITLARDWRQSMAAFVPSARWRSLLPATVLGTYVAMLLWLGGFKWADASTAAVLNQMSTVYMLVMAWGVLGEPLTRRQVAGSLIAVAGALTIVLS